MVAALVLLSLLAIAAPASASETIRASLTWDQPVDIDLHIYDADGDHAWYAELTSIPEARLTHDNIAGFPSDTAPEEFADSRIPADRPVAYRICYFGAHGETVPVTHVTLAVTDPDGTQRSVQVTLREVSECQDATMSPAGHVAQAVGQADSATGSTMVDPFTGQLDIWMPSGSRSALTVVRRFECDPSSVEPTNVRIVLLDGATEIASQPAERLDQGGGYVYRATFAEGQLQNHVLIALTGDCSGAPTTFPLGTLALIDPSGRITDSTTGLPVVSATVTLYRVPEWVPRTGPSDMRPQSCETPESRPAGMPFTQPVPSSGGLEAEPLDPYNPIDPAVNPILTNNDGRFAWNVASGSCWYVVVTKEGYITQTSPLIGVTVLPVVDLDLQLVPVNTPPNTPTTPPSEPDQPTPSQIVKTRLTLQLRGRKRPVATGKLISVGRGRDCSANASILIEKRVGSRRSTTWMVVSRLSTNARGAFRTTLGGGRGAYRASFLGSTVDTLICQRSHSASRRR